MSCRVSMKETCLQKIYHFCLSQKSSTSMRTLKCHFAVNESKQTSAIFPINLLPKTAVAILRIWSLRSGPTFAEQGLAILHRFLGGGGRHHQQLGVGGELRLPLGGWNAVGLAAKFGLWLFFGKGFSKFNLRDHQKTRCFGIGWI